MNLIQICATRRGEILGAIHANIGLRRFNIRHVRSGFHASAGNGDVARRDVPMPSLTQKALNHSLRLRVVALTKMMMANPTVCVDEVMRWPVFVVEATPNRIVVVDSNGIIDAKALHSSTDVVDVPLERELRS